MSGFFSKIFGGGKKDDSSTSSKPGVAGGTSGHYSGESTVELVEQTLEGLLEKALLDLSFEVRTDTSGPTEEISIELSGADEDLLTEKEGALLDAFQLFFKRALQHQLPDARVNISFDCNGYREESSRALVDLADKLKEKALTQGRSVYLRALPPKDRKIIHQHLATDERVRSRSVGEGLYKKIKIFPVKADGEAEAADSTETSESI